jgi:3-methyl-2-oxobutanoate hydroxymethyltransferase
MSIPVGKLQLPELKAMKRRGEKIVMVTAYDAPGARFAEDAGIDVILVGDTAAMVVLGHSGTSPVTVDEMLFLTRTVSRQVHRPIVVGDLPFGSYESSDEDAVRTAVRFVKEGGADIVKLEGAGPMVSRARSIVDAGIPVMGHVGLTPQASAGPEGYRVRGTTADEVSGIRRDVDALVAAGCFALVFEAIPAAVAALLVPRVAVPVIGIGAGAATDGQVLVFHDLVGLSDGHVPRFVKRFAELRPLMIDAVARFAAETRARTFPAPAHAYRLPAAELDAARRALADGSDAGGVVRPGSSDR